MLDSVQFQIKAPVRPKYRRAFYDVIMSISSNQRFKAIGDINDWMLQSQSIKPHKSYGYNALWKATHKSGAWILFCGDVVIAFGGSLPRILFGNNAEELTNQTELDEALERLVDICDQVADIRDRVRYAKFKRIDLISYLNIPLPILKRALAHGRHPCHRAPPIIRSNSMEWDGTSIGGFAYDKEIKCKAPSIGRTRFEWRLLNPETINRLPALFCEGQISFEGADKVFRKLLSQFPGQGMLEVHKSGQGLHEYLAWLTMEPRIPAEVDPLGVYCDMLCGNFDARSRLRRDVAKAVPNVMRVRLADLIMPPTNARGVTLTSN